MNTEHDSVVTKAELPGDNDAGDEGEGNGDNGETMEEMGDG